MLQRAVILFLLTAVLPLAAQQENMRVMVERADVEAMYAQAKATLEDTSIPNVESVPNMLEQCTHHGYAPAARLLLDVYEGRFKGLEAKPVPACELAEKIAETPLPDPDDPDCIQLQKEALFRLALYKERGYGCTADPQQAFIYMYKAAEKGYGEARVQLARYLMTGKMCKPNPALAWELLKRQANKDPRTPHVFFYMGYICYKGVGHSSNPRKAADFFHLGAKMNDADCMNNLAAMYESGIAVKRDAGTALTLYRKAAALGNKRASANMQRLAFKEGRRADRDTGHSAGRRITNALLHVVQALPISNAHKEALRYHLN